jgi:hypothetical protein
MTITNRLSKTEQAILINCPPAGGGVHHWIFRCLRILAPHYKSDQSLLNAMQALCANHATRHVDTGEILRQIPNARGQKATGIRTPGKWPSLNEQAIRSLVSAGGDLATLRSASPVDPATVGTQDLIDFLFPENPLLCLGATEASFRTNPRAWWRGKEAHQQFIVPSPMSSVLGTAKDGKRSQRTLSNTGPRTHLVIECDFKPETLARFGCTGSTFDLCAVVLSHLSKILPMRMVVHSGGKSLHSWHPCADVPDSQLRRFMEYAVSLGADHVTWSRCQLVRMPNGLRDNGARQEVIFFNPHLVPAP